MQVRVLPGSRDEIGLEPDRIEDVVVCKPLGNILPVRRGSMNARDPAADFRGESGLSSVSRFRTVAPSATVRNRENSGVKTMQP